MNPDGNETKTRRCGVPEETFDFPGYTNGRRRTTGRADLGTKPSAKMIARLKREDRDSPISIYTTYGDRST